MFSFLSPFFFLFGISMRCPQQLRSLVDKPRVCEIIPNEPGLRFSCRLLSGQALERVLMLLASLLSCCKCPDSLVGDSVIMGFNNAKTRRACVHTCMLDWRPARVLSAHFAAPHGRPIILRQTNPADRSWAIWDHVRCGGEGRLPSALGRRDRKRDSDFVKFVRKTPLVVQ
jgi:hypothetical protein